jgi:hypothetical protein
MLSFKEYTKLHGMKNYLFHGTTAENMNRILKENAMRGSTARGFGSSVRVDKPSIFFSRSHRMALWFIRDFRYERHPVILTLDRTLLAQKYSIMPVQNNLRRDNDPDFDRNGARAGHRGILEEEVIIGDITNISKYIVAIDAVYDQTYEQITRTKSKYTYIKKSGKFRLNERALDLI